MQTYEVTYRCLHSDIITAKSIEEAIERVCDNCEYDIVGEVYAEDITEEIEKPDFTKRGIEAEG